ncbi:peptidase dimerization domain-containing protein [Streptomyces prunicolor]|uniref:peptidase dimerization domain-containing protein n=1 Tax=Streptomyces prunicolor TaxID=67348 RepID=UPI0037242A7C
MASPVSAEGFAMLRDAGEQCGPVVHALTKLSAPTRLSVAASEEAGRSSCCWYERRVRTISWCGTGARHGGRFSNTGPVGTPLRVAVLVEGEEEAGSPTLAALPADHSDLARADLVPAPDAVNAGPPAPTLTVSLRGMLNVLVTVRTADRGAHSGISGGAVPDALGALIRLLATLTDSDSDGAVAIAGLHPGVDAENGPDAADIRADSGLSPDVELIGRGSLGKRLWHGPAVTITGIDAPAAAGAANVPVPVAVARAAVSVRPAPEDDPVRAMHALTKHLHAHAPWGTAVEFEAVGSGGG